MPRYTSNNSKTLNIGNRTGDTKSPPLTVYDVNIQNGLYNANYTRPKQNIGYTVLV